MTKVIEMKKRLNFTPHPNTIFGKKVEKGETASGIIISNVKSKTPMVEILCIGSNAKDQIEKAKDFDLEIGDVVYANPNYMGLAEIDGIEGQIIPMDGIFGKIPQTEE